MSETPKEGVTSSMILLPDLAEVASARRFVAKVAAEAGFSETRIFDITVACSEAAANAIEHAPVKGRVDVRTVVSPDRLEIQVEGPSRFRSPNRIMENSNRGLGLPLMAQLSDHLALYCGPRGGTMIGLTFYREAAAGAEGNGGCLPPSVREIVRESELLSAITENAPVGICVLDPELRFRWVNPAYQSFLDEPYRSMDLTGVRFEDAVLGARDAGAVADLERASRTGRFLPRGEHEMLGFTRGPTWWRRSVVPLKGNRKQGPFDLLLVVSEETDRMMAEEAMRNSAAGNELLLDLSDTLRPLANPAEIIRAAASALGRHLDLAAVGYVEVGPGGEMWRSPGEYNDGRIGRLAGQHNVSDLGHFGEIIRSGADLYLDDYETDGRVLPSRSERVGGLAIRSAAAIPLMKNGLLVAFMYAIHPFPRSWAEEQRAVFREVAERTWAAVERARAEESLRENEEWLGSILEQLPAAVGVCDARGGFLLANRAMRRFTADGLVPSNDPARQFKWKATDARGEGLSAEGWPGALALRGESVSPGVEVCVETSDGHAWMDIAATPLKHGDDVAGAIVIAQDICSRKKAEEDLSFQAMLLANVHDALVATDEDLKINFWNKEAEEMLGWSADEVMGRRLADVLGTETPYLSSKSAAESLGAGGDFEATITYRHKDGREVISETRASVLKGAQGEFRGTVSAIRDITARLRTEQTLKQGRERLELALSAGRLATWDYRLTTGETTWNELHFQIMGYKPGEVEASHQAWLDRIHPKDRRKAEGAFLRALKHGGHYSVDFRSLWPNGTVRWMESHGYMEHDATGEPVRCYGVMVDSTRRKQAQLALRQSERRYRTLAAENERLYRQQLDIAESLQLALLNIPSEIGNIRVGHLYRSATEAARVGGDFYDVFEVKDGNIAVLIGDVAGHGIQAARTATLVKDVVHAFTHQTLRTREVLRRTNALLIEKDLPGFVSLFLAILDGYSGHLLYSYAGHPDTLLRRASGEILRLGSGSPPLGVHPEAAWKACEIELQAGDLLLLYTDGVVEARREGQMFGEKRLERLLRRKRISVERLPTLVLDQVLAFSGGTLSDDVAVLALSLTEVSSPPGPPPPFRQERLLE